MQFVSYQRLAQDVVSWSEKLALTIDLVVGIPRSGMLVANILALHRNVKLASLPEFVEGRLHKGGLRDKHNELKTVLVVDDSILSGRSIRDAQDLLTRQERKYKIYYGCLYIKDPTPAYFYHRIVPTPRIFEWNVFHGYWLDYACVDIDGVLCRDPTRSENDDGKLYRRFLQTVEPRYKPTVKIKTIVTSRLEKYREETLDWLNYHRIKFDKLIMHDADTAHERRAAGDHAKRKAEEYKSAEYKLFIESSIRQSREIAALTGKPVLCTDTMQLV